MTSDLYRPSVAQQIAAVQLAEIHVSENMRRQRRRQSEINEVCRRLLAAVETLRMLETSAAEFEVREGDGDVERGGPAGAARGRARAQEKP